MHAHTDRQRECYSSSPFSDVMDTASEVRTAAATATVTRNDEEVLFFLFFMLSVLQVKMASKRGRPKSVSIHICLEDLDAMAERVSYYDAPL